MTVRSVQRSVLKYLSRSIQRLEKAERVLNAVQVNAVHSCSASGVLLDLRVPEYVVFNGTYVQAKLNLDIRKFGTSSSMYMYNAPRQMISAPNLNKLNRGACDNFHSDYLYFIFSGSGQLFDFLSCLEINACISAFQWPSVAFNPLAMKAFIIFANLLINCYGFKWQYNSTYRKLEYTVPEVTMENFEDFLFEQKTLDTYVGFIVDERWCRHGSRFVCYFNEVDHMFRVGNASFCQESDWENGTIDSE